MKSISGSAQTRGNIKLQQDKRAKIRPRVFIPPQELRNAGGQLSDDVQTTLRQAVIDCADKSLTRRLRYIDPTDTTQPIPPLRPWTANRDGAMGELLDMREDASDIDSLALAYALTGQHTYAEKAWNNVRDMLTVYEAFGSFHPHRRNNDLAAAHSFGAIAMTWDLCYDVRPEEVGRLVLEEGVRRAREMYAVAVRDWHLNGLPINFPTPGVSMIRGPENRNIYAMLMTNHCWVNIGFLGNLAMALEGEDVSGAGPGSGPEDWLRFAIHFFSYIVDILPADGSYPESRVYGAPYGAAGISRFLCTLRNVKGIDLFARTPYFRNFAYGRLYGVWDHARHVGISNFGEGSAESEWNCMQWIWAFASAYQDRVLQWSANAWHRAEPVQLDIAWQYLLYDQTLSEQTPDEAKFPLAVCHTDVSHIHVRAGKEPWGSKQEVLSFRGSLVCRAQFELVSQGRLPFIMSWHMHPSRNAVILAVGGKMLIGRAAVNHARGGTQHYSVLQVNGEDQQEPEIALEGVTNFDSMDKYVTFSSEIGPAYPDLDTYTRRVVCISPGVYFIIDQATAHNPVEMIYRLHFGKQANAEAIGPSMQKTIRVIGKLSDEEPFTCDVVSPDSLTSNFARAPGGNASHTLCYGPPSPARTSRAAAIIRLGICNMNAPAAFPVTSDRDGTFGAAFITLSGLCVVVAVMGTSLDEPPEHTWYYLQGKASNGRHLVAGLRGDRRYSVHSKYDEFGVSVNIVPDGELLASPKGTLLFDLSSTSKALQVSVTPQRNLLL